MVEHAVTDVVVDTNGDAADSTGDLLTFHNELFDASNAEVVGTDQGECVRIEVGVSWECRWINFLDGGSITVEGPFFDAGPSTLAITGGTGAYRRARGTMRLVTANEAGTEFDFFFRILTD
jgi:allene oxide cyclase